MFIAIQQPRHGNNLMSTDRWMDKEDIYIVVHGQRSPVGYSPLCRKESDTTVRLPHTHTQWNTSQSIKNKIMPFAATWMQLDIIVLSEVSQKEKDKYHMISFICGI